MKPAIRAIPEIRILHGGQRRKLLILFSSGNGIKIAYTVAASDAQALRRRAMRNMFRPTESSDPTRLARAGASTSPKAQKAEGNFREASDWPLSTENHR
jgi:hypothetical protein